MKIYVLAILFICTTQLFYAQEEDGVVSLALPVRNSLTFNRYVLNPTFSFVREQHKFISIYNKREWVQFEDAPQTYLASYSGRFGENIGAGLGLFQQNYGVLTTFGGLLNFAYNVRIQRESNLTFGLNIGAYGSGVNTSNVVTNFQDPSLENVPSNFLLTVNPGINYGIEFLDFGVSINNLVLYNINSSELIEDNPEQSIQAHVMHTGYINSRGFFDESKFSGLVRSEFKKDNTIISALAMLTVPKGIWAQVGYNSLYGASGGLGLNITKQIAIEYSFEKALGDLVDFGSSHEITLAYRFNNNNNYNYSGGDEVSGLLSTDKKFKRRKPRLTKAQAETNRRLALERKAKEEADRKAKALAKTEAENKAKAEAKIEAERKAKEAAEAKAKIDAENKVKAATEAKEKLEAEKKAKEVAEAQAKVDADIRAQAVEAARLRAKEKLEEEKKAKEAAAAQAKVDADIRAQAVEAARLRAKEKLEEEKKAKEAAAAQAKVDADIRAQAVEAAKLRAKEKLEEEKKAKDAQTKIDADKKAKAEAEANAKLEAERKAKGAAEAQARIDAENKAIAEAQRKAKEAAEAQAKIDAAEKAQQELINNPKDDIGKSMNALTKATDNSKTKQKDLLDRLSKAVAIKDEDLKALKEENDLSEKGIYKAPRPFKSITAENRAIQAIKIDLDNVIEERSKKIEELESLFDDKFEADTLTNDEVMLYYKKKIKGLKSEQATAVKAKADLESTLETINVATEFERRRRIKRAAFNNENDRYVQDRAILKSIKENTPLSETPLQEEDFDTGEAKSDNIKILKNVNNVENGYYLIIAVHNDAAKRDEFITKVVASGRRDIDFFHDVSTSKYYIYYKKANSIEAANEELKTKGNRPYNTKMSIIKIEN